MILALLIAAAPVSRIDAAIDALKNDSSLKVRTQAAIILGQRGAHAAIPALRKAVAGDDSAAVRIASIGALTKLKARSARPTLQAALETDPEESVRAAADRLALTTFYGGFRLERQTGRQIGHRMVVVQWQGRMKRIVWPPEVAEAALRVVVSS